MKLLTFAIASIVDANTGHGLGRPAQGAVYDAEIRRGRSLRSLTVLATLRALRDSVAAQLQRYRQRVRQSRELKRLLRLDDRQLADIGLERGDLVAADMGIITPAELHLRWAAGRQRESAYRGHPEAATARLAVEFDAANEPRFGRTRCA